MLYRVLIFLCFYLFISGMENGDIQKIFEIKDAPELTQEKKDFFRHLDNLSSCPLEEFCKTLENNAYKNNPKDILASAIERSMIKIVERTIAYYPEAITNDIVNKAEQRCKEKIHELNSMETIKKLSETNKEKLIECMIAANKRFNLSHERASFLIEMRIHNHERMKFIFMHNMILSNNLWQDLKNQYAHMNRELDALNKSISVSQKSYLAILPKELKQELYEFARKRWIDEVRENGLKVLAEVEKKREEHEKLKNENTQQNPSVSDKCIVM